jgi:glycosyltransferase involved in cell wall biosynthesis
MSPTLEVSREGGAEPITVAYFLRSWPRLSQTFILSEILMLEAQGMVVRVVGLESSGEQLVQPDVARVRGPIAYLNELLPRSRQGRALLHLRTFLSAPAPYLRALICVAKGTREHRSGYHNYSGWRCFDLAAAAASMLSEAGSSDKRVGHLHAHFAHDPAFVGLLVHLLTGIPFSFTAHARDLYQIEPRALVRRAGKAGHVVTCCRANRDYLSSRLPPRLGSRIRLIHHGVDVKVFHPPETRRSSQLPAPRLVTVARLVEKKGLTDLIRACHILAQREVGFGCLIYGDGPQRAELESLIEAFGLAGRVSLMGSCTQSELVDVYQGADIFVLTPYVTGEGDRDGIPNVIMEAMASALPVLVTDSGGVDEIVVDGVNGLVAAPRDVEGIARGLDVLLGDADLRAQLGAAGRRTVVGGWDAWACSAELACVFRSTVHASIRSEVGQGQDAAEMHEVFE